MSDFIKTQQLALELVDRQEPVDYAGDADGRMFILVFKKTSKTACKSPTWLLQRAEDFKQAGNSYYSNPAKRKHPEEAVCSNPRVQVLWKAVACYVQGLDCLTLVRSDLYKDQHDTADTTPAERERQLALLSSRPPAPLNHRAPLSWKQLQGLYSGIVLRKTKITLRHCRKAVLQSGCGISGVGSNSRDVPTRPQSCQPGSGDLAAVGFSMGSKCQYLDVPPATVKDCAPEWDRAIERKAKILEAMQRHRD